MLYDIFARIALGKIEEAYENGEFEKLSCKGQHIDLRDWANTPKEMRAAYTILKNSGFVPEEVRLLKEVAVLKRKIEQSANEEERDKLEIKLSDTQLKYNLLLDQAKTRKR